MPRPAVTIRIVPGTVTPSWCGRCDDRRAVVREAVERVAADLGGTVLEGGDGGGVDH